MGEKLVHRTSVVSPLREAGGPVSYGAFAGVSVDRFDFEMRTNAMVCISGFFTSII
jgi:hypothetical protein